MIGAADVRACGDLAGVIDLVGKLGYATAPVAIDPVRWETIGVGAELAESVRVSRVANLGPIEIYAGEGEAAASEVTQFTSKLSAWNTVTKFVLLYRSSGTGRLSIYGTDPRRRLRRIDLDPQRPRADALERLQGFARAGRPPSELVAAMEKALEKEEIGKCFFTRFRDDVARFTTELLRLHPQETRDAAASEALLVLSRILFLYFIQQKRWLDGSVSFVAELVEQSRRVRGGLFTGVFLPLFFGCLNTPVRARDPFARRFGRIPYLNGGLFEPSAYEVRHPVLPVDDAVLEQIVFETFERFQFAVEEDDEVGAHIDPEMLGHVFENLMAEEERLVSGSFYTPRPVVDALVCRGLAAWCGAGDAAVAEAVTRWTAGDEDALSECDAPSLLERLESIRVLDPACGSGAFLLAALQWIARLDTSLRAIRGVPPDLSVRRRIVADSLFGVDLKPEAVRLCELRLWLAVVAAWNGPPMAVEPLPNLDRNILQGDALLGPLDWPEATRPGMYRDWAFALRAREQLAARYRAARSAERATLCRALRDSDRDLALGFLDRSIESAQVEIEELSRRQGSLFPTSARNERRIAETRARIDAWSEARDRLRAGEVGFFAPEVHFDHVLRNGGFDLVIGNPPWVRLARIRPAIRKSLADRYPMFRADGGSPIPQSDLSLAFFERSLALAAPGGSVALLMPAKVATAGYGAVFRTHVQRRVDLVALEAWSDRGRRLFQADTFPLGVVVRKAEPTGPVEVRDQEQTIRLEQSALARRAGAPWVLAPREVGRILERLRRAHPSFASTFGAPVMGVKSGANAEFFVDPEVDVRRGTARVRGIEIPLSALVRVVRGRDVRKWRAEGSRWMLWPEAGAPWVRQLLGGNGRAPRLAYVRREHREAKVVWRDVSRGVAAAPLGANTRWHGRAVAIVPNQTVYCAAVENEDRALIAAAILNSTVAGALLVSIADRAKDFHYRYFARTVATLPVPRLQPADEASLAELARRGARGELVDEALDEVVADAYGLSTTELDRLTSFLRHRLGRHLEVEPAKAPLFG
ncbi:MAG: Eco57I restriction-modification methylase domain-containing protein [Thermoanaerobaculia bacterium]